MTGWLPFETVSEPGTVEWLFREGRRSNGGVFEVLGD
jgi:hypothetical protein